MNNQHTILVMAVFFVFSILIESVYALNLSNEKRKYFADADPGSVKLLEVEGGQHYCALSAAYNPFNDRQSRLRSKLDYKSKAAIFNWLRAEDRELSAIEFHSWKATNPWESNGRFFSVGCIQVSSLKRIYGVPNGGQKKQTTSISGSSIAEQLQVEKKQLLEYLDSSPNDIPALKELTEIYRALGDIDSASKTLDKVMMLEF